MPLGEQTHEHKNAKHTHRDISRCSERCIRLSMCVVWTRAPARSLVVFGITKRHSLKSFEHTEFQPQPRNDTTDIYTLYRSIRECVRKAPDTYQCDYTLCCYIIYCNDLLLCVLLQHYEWFSFFFLLVRPLHFRWQSDCLLLTDSFIKGQIQKKKKINQTLISRCENFATLGTLFGSTLYHCDLTVRAVLPSKKKPITSVFAERFEHSIAFIDVKLNFINVYLTGRYMDTDTMSDPMRYDHSIVWWFNPTIIIVRSSRYPHTH